MGELDPRIRIRAALRCDGIGRLDCAEDTVSGDRLAVRWLPLEANGDAAVKACEKLPAHHALPRILQTGQVGASAFVALDFPEGEMLAARGEERLDNELLLKIAGQLSDALATVHSQGVVHGEMSRDSVLLSGESSNCKASLWDMPLVIANRLSDRRGENRLMQNLVKTAPYLSPERARGEGASQAGDVYALGAILCVSAGAPLPTASTTLGVVNLIGSGEWKPRVPESLPEKYVSMLKRMVAAEPSERPSATEVALCFAQVPTQNSLPTVPELQAVRLPPEILAAADALMQKQLEAMRAPTREMSLAQVEASLAEKAALQEEMTAAIAEPAKTETTQTTQTTEKTEKTEEKSEAKALEVAPLPMAVDPLPALELKPTEAPVPMPVRMMVQANTLDQVSEVARDVVRIPTQEIEAVRLEAAAAAPVAEPVKPVVAPVASVPVNDSLAVAPDLLAAGVTTLSAEEVEAIRANNLKVWTVFGGLMGAAVALIGVVVMLATRTPEVIVAPEAPKPTVAPVKTVKAPVALDELTPLSKIAPKKVARPVAPVAAPEAAEVAPPAPVEEPATEPLVEKTAEKTAEKLSEKDFSFLESAEAPKSELKRPSTEL